MATRDSSDHGWISISRVEYEKKLVHGYAGPGKPWDPELPGYWVLGRAVEDGATCLWTGVSIDER